MREVENHNVENMVINIVQNAQSYKISIDLNLPKDVKTMLRDNVVTNVNDLANHLDLDTEYLLKNILGGTGK
ncbi:gp36 [Listeria phage P35]|uniref:Uncharacterized protein n=1 Tax=Listeria phage LP-083-1 TaxID=1458854 RepID=A0A059T800_9CAUD|nr:gp36 [Listeria phage P35]AAY53221.1 gp36 [Listeria phage P35]AHL19001.1 hypothetical protein LP083-1_036 [Listeria phage LP-083-1]